MTSRRIFLSGGAVFAAALTTAPRLLADGGAPTINTGKKTKKSNTSSKPSADCKNMATQLKGLDRKLNTLTNNRKSAIRRLTQANNDVESADEQIQFWKNEVKALEKLAKQLKVDKKRGYTLIGNTRYDVSADEVIKEEKELDRAISKAKNKREREIDKWVKLKSKADDRRQKVKDIDAEVQDIARQKRSLEKAYKRAKCS